jgi:hypothetical protein
MKRRLTLSIAFALGVTLLSVMSTASVNAQSSSNMEPVAETGLIFLNSDEVLVVTGKWKTFRGGGLMLHESAGVTRYAAATCDDASACRHLPVSTTESLVTTSGDEAVSWEIRPTPGIARQGISVVISSNRPNRRAVAGIIYKIVNTPGQAERKEYVGHVTLTQ